MTQYVARLCWNSTTWTRPTGESAKTEKGTYAAKTGYGHEEWLFNFQWELRGWKYGFLQPVNRSFANVCGQTIDVRLYTIAPKTGWFYVGRIPKCEVITEEQAATARAAYRKKGWLKDMEAHVRQIGGKLKELHHKESRFTFNVRFRPSEIELYDPMTSVGARDALRRLRRYTLVPLEGSRTRIISEWPTRSGTTRPRSKGRTTRKGSAGSVIDPVHAQLQAELFAHLRKQFGHSSVVMEEGFADVKLRHRKAVHLFEVKSDPRPRKAIREALGQLLEYAFVCKRNGERIGKLIVAAPGEITGLDRKYLDHLRDARGLPVHYVCLRRGVKLLALPW
jgi:hypothetical protein